MMKTSSDDLRYYETHDVPGCVRPSPLHAPPPRQLALGRGVGGLDEMHAHTGSS